MDRVNASCSHIVSESNIVRCKKNNECNTVKLQSEDGKLKVWSSQHSVQFVYLHGCLWTSMEWREPTIWERMTKHFLDGQPPRQSFSTVSLQPLNILNIEHKQETIWCFRIWYKTTPCPEKKRTNSILCITSSNTGRFSKFFQRRNLEEICYKTVVKFPTTPQTRRYTTLWKTDVRKLVNQRDAWHHFVAQN